MVSTHSHAVRTTVIIIVVLVVLIGIGLILYFFVFKKKIVTPPVTPPFVTPPSVTPPSVIPPSVTPPSVTPPSVTPPSVTPPSVTPPSPATKYCPVGECIGSCSTNPNIPRFCKTAPGTVFESNGQWYITIPNTTDTSKCLPLFAVTPVTDNSVTCILARGIATPCIGETNVNGGCYTYLQD